MQVFPETVQIFRTSDKIWLYFANTSIVTNVLKAHETSEITVRQVPFHLRQYRVPLVSGIYSPLVSVLAYILRQQYSQLIVIQGL